MIGRRRALALIYVTFVLAFTGVIVFIGGITLELFADERRPANVSPYVGVALAALCFAALMFVILFTLVGVLLARQTRSLGSGYGDAYRLIEEFRFRDAIPLLERSLHEGKETPDVLMLLSSAYAYTGQLAKAQAAGDRAVERFPDDPQAYITLASSYRLQAAYDEAAQTLYRATALAPEQPMIWAELGFTQQFAGEGETAIASFEQAAQHPMPAPYAVRVFYHLANAYQARGETQKAMRAAAKMMSARQGLQTWKTSLKALEGTAYGQALRYEVATIEQSIAEADASSFG